MYQCDVRISIVMVTVSYCHNYWTRCYCSRITFKQIDKNWWNLCRNIGSTLGATISGRPIKFHTTCLRWLTPKSIQSKSTQSQKRMTIAMKINTNAGRGWKLFIKPSGWPGNVQAILLDNSVQTICLPLWQMHAPLPDSHINNALLKSQWHHADADITR